MMGYTSHNIIESPGGVGSTPGVSQQGGTPVTEPQYTLPTRVCPFPGCTTQVKGNHRYCGAHERYRQRNGLLEKPRPRRKSPSDRFWSRVDRSAGPDGCWLHLGCLDEEGYASFYVNGRTVQAHRFAYEITVGPIPPGLHLDHVKARGCTHRNCVNPAHLEPVTPRENTRRSENFTAKHMRQTECLHGHAFTPENTIRNEKGHRRCRTCMNARSRESKRRRRAAQQQMA
jgi:hypothetical protein